MCLGSSGADAAGTGTTAGRMVLGMAMTASRAIGAALLLLATQSSENIPFWTTTTIFSMVDMTSGHQEVEQLSGKTL